MLFNVVHQYFFDEINTDVITISISMFCRLKTNCNKHLTEKTKVDKHITYKFNIQL